MSEETNITKREREQKEMAACMARVFLGDEDGKRVLAYLRQRFGVERPVFRRSPGQRYDAMEAALHDGERHVMAEIEAALKTASPQLWAISLI